MARKDRKRSSTERKPAAAPAARDAESRGAAVPPDRPGRWEGPATVGLIALLLVVFFNPVFFSGKTFQPPDVTASAAHQPYLQQCFEEEGSLIDRYPLWTPYIFSGMPSFASLTAAPWTNPTGILLFFMSGSVKVVAYYFFLALFIWILLRRRGLAPVTALLGAAAYVFCAHVVTMIMFGHNTKIAALIYLPVLVMATDELWKRPSVLWTALLAGATGNMLLTSHMQIAYYAFLAAGLLMLVATVRGFRDLGLPAVLARWGIWAAGLGVGFLASFVLFLPVREYSKFSIRGGTEGGLPYDYATNWSLHPLEVSTFFIPSFFGFGQSTYWGWMPFTDFPHYMGILPLFLAVLTVVLWPRERFHVFLYGLGLFSLLVAFGKHLPLVYNAMFEFVPYFNKFRVPSMITVLLQFAVALLAAIGLDRLLKGLTGDAAARARRALVVVGSGFAAIVLVLGGLVAGGALETTVSRRIVERMPPQEGVTPEQLAAYGSRMAGEVADMAAADLGRVLVIFALGWALLWFTLRGKMPRRAAAWGILALVLVDLWIVGAKPATYHDRREDPNAFARTPAVEFLQSAPGEFRILPLTGKGANNNWFAYFRIPSILGYHPAKLKIYQDLIDDRGPVGVSRTISQGNFNIVDMLNARYIVADDRYASALVQFDRERFRPAARGGGEVVLENTRVLPRMWFAEGTRVIADPDEHLRALGNPLWDPRSETLLFEDLGAFDPGAGGSAAITRYSPRELDATVESPGRCLLVLSEVYYGPGWHAFLDGERIPVHRVNYVLRAVEVPPGNHELQMRFDPGSFMNGAYLSVGSYALVLLAIAAAAAPWPRRGRRRSSGADGAPPPADAVS